MISWVIGATRSHNGLPDGSGTLIRPPRGDRLRQRFSRPQDDGSPAWPAALRWEAAFG
jgi:hypothetical protein